MDCIGERSQRSFSEVMHQIGSPAGFELRGPVQGRVNERECWTTRALQLNSLKAASKMSDSGSILVSHCRVLSWRCISREPELTLVPS